MSDSAATDEFVVLETPAEGIPAVIDTVDGYLAAIATLAAGRGPLAVDTERAHGFRYSAQAYLIQLRRDGAGTILIDPTALAQDGPHADLSQLAEVLADTMWIIHAATQDLPCLAEVGMVPRTLFDTELAGRLLGLPRVSLSALTELAFGITLKKEHSAADWSTRPLPQDWLNYAALDVELLPQLQAWTQDQLVQAGKDEWARQEFAYLAAHAGDAPTERIDPWRRTSGIHLVRSRQGLAIVRELWQARDVIAAELDRSPSRVLADQAISELAQRASQGAIPSNGRELRQVKGFRWRLAVRYESDWLDALDRVADMSPQEFPPTSITPDGPPPPRTWIQRNPDAHARWSAMRPALVAHAEALQLPVENLLTPDIQRRLAWQPPTDLSDVGVDAFLVELEARPWQREIVVPLLTPLLQKQR